MQKCAWGSLQNPPKELIHKREQGKPSALPPSVSKPGPQRGVTVEWAQGPTDERATSFCMGPMLATFLLSLPHRRQARETRPRKDVPVATGSFDLKEAKEMAPGGSPQLDDKSICFVYKNASGYTCACEMAFHWTRPLGQWTGSKTTVFHKQILSTGDVRNWTWGYPCKAGVLPLTCKPPPLKQRDRQKAELTANSCAEKSLRWDLGELLLLRAELKGLIIKATLHILTYRWLWMGCWW